MTPSYYSTDFINNEIQWIKDEIYDLTLHDNFVDDLVDTTCALDYYLENLGNQDKVRAIVYIEKCIETDGILRLIYVLFGYKSRFYEFAINTSFDFENNECRIPFSVDEPEQNRHYDYNQYFIDKLSYNDYVVLQIDSTRTNYSTVSIIYGVCEQKSTLDYNGAYLTVQYETISDNVVDEFETNMPYGDVALEAGIILSLDRYAHIAPAPRDPSGDLMEDYLHTYVWNMICNITDLFVDLVSLDGDIPTFETDDNIKIVEKSQEIQLRLIGSLAGYLLVIGTDGCADEELIEEVTELYFGSREPDIVNHMFSILDSIVYDIIQQFLSISTYAYLDDSHLDEQTKNIVLVRKDIWIGDEIIGAFNTLHLPNSNRLRNASNGYDNSCENTSRRDRRTHSVRTR